jgi:hypothetical protein
MTSSIAARDARHPECRAQKPEDKNNKANEE